MRIEAKELVKMFYEDYKDVLGDLSYKEVEDICLYPFKSTRKYIESGNLPSVRLQYFGVFTIHKRKAQSELISIKKMFDNKEITPEKYFSMKSMLEKFINEYENNNKRLRRG